MDTDIDIPVTPLDVVHTIKKNMVEWERSGMWPLSCYTHMDSCPCLPGFVDYSPEEVRWQAYITEIQGNSQNYLVLMKQLAEKQQLLWKRYQNITTDEAVKLSRDNTPNLFGSKETHLGTNGEFFTSSQDTQSFFSTQGTPSKDLFGTKMGPIGEEVFSPLPPISSNQSGIQIGTSTSIASSTTTHPPIYDVTGTHPTTSLSSTSVPKLNLEQTGLTQSELAAYQAKEFVLGQIPETPPPPVLCH